MKILMAAGGSGGHIYPALTLASELVLKGHDVTFFGSNDRMEKEVIPSSGFEFIGLDIYTTKGSIFQKVKSMVSLIDAYFKCLKIVEKYDIVMGFGNYISVPIMLAAKSKKKKLVIHEQNSFVGRANRLLDKKADLIIGSYEENKKQFKNPNIKILGNPQVSKALKVEKDENVLVNLGLKKELKTVLIFMGSLGSASVNKILMDYFKMLDGTYQVIYATGEYNYEKVINEIPSNDYLKIYKRVDGIKLMKNVDLLISRAGATTLAEICAVGIPSILIPSPYVPNNHQYHNGKALVDLKAAKMIEEKDLSSRLLYEEVKNLLSKQDLLDEMATNARGSINLHVVDDIIRELESL